jgi:hypothetical protein
MPVPQGLSIKGIITRMYEESKTPAIYRDYRVMVEVNGEPVSRDDWDGIPSEQDHVLVYVPVRGGDGGKDPTRMIMMLAVVGLAIAAPYGIAAMTGGNLLTFAGMSVAATTYMYSGIALTAGMMLVNAIAPVRPTSPDATWAAQEKTESPTYSLQGARNTSTPFGPIPVVLGSHRMYPPYGAKPYTELVGNDEYLRMLFIWGYGPLKIEDLRIGDTPIANFEGVTLETREGWSTDAPITLIPNTVDQEQIGVELIQGAAGTIRAAEPYVDEISVDVAFPQGLQVIQKDWGSRLHHGVTVTVEYREIGSATWITYASQLITGNTTSLLRYGFSWAVDRTKKYEVRLTKTTGNAVNPAIIGDIEAEIILHQTYWSVIRGRKYENPINFPYPLAMTAIRIKASNQLQGVIDSLNAIVTSYAPTWNGSAWTTAWTTTNNPAALYRLVLMHPANAKRRTAAQINNANLGAWFTTCAAEGYRFNMIRDYRSSVWDCLFDIATAGRAGVSLVDGTWGSIVDCADRPVMNHITPRNSWGFSAEKSYFNRPHAFRCRFKNELNDYEWDELIVYDDGYTSANATQFETIEFPGITHPSLVWKFGRYHIAQARLRPETYSVYQDWEHLVAPRGSKVRCAYDVPLWGSGWGRVKSVTLNEAETHTTGVVLDDTVVMAAGTLYGVRFRLPDADNTSLYLSVLTVAGETNTLTFSTSVPVASGPAVNDLAMFGEATRETVDLLVKEVQMQNEFVARLILVDEAPEIYDADTGAIPAFDTYITQPLDVTKIQPPAPSIAGIQSGTSALETFSGGARARIFVSLYRGLGNVPIDKYRVRYSHTGVALNWQFVETPAENQTAIITGVTDGETYQIQAQAISIYGVASAWSDAVTHTVIGQSENPSDVEDLACNIVGTVAHLTWTAVTDVDLSHYRIRWSPLTSGATWANAIDVVERVGKPATSVTVPAMVGTYLIKAVDFAGHMSDTAGAAITNIAAISGLNVVETVTQPPFVGLGYNVGYDAGYSGLILQGVGDIYEVDDAYALGEVYTYGGLSEGTFTFDQDIIDLGDIYTSRLTASLSISGVDLLSDVYAIEDVYSVANIYGASEGSYTAQLEIRTTSDDPAGAPAWSDWIPFMVGDYTARAFEFRVRLKGTAPGITPIVTSITVTVDMPDRVIGFSDTVPAGGKTIPFSPAFYELQGVGISVSDGEEGDKITKSENVGGLTIAFTNGGSAVARNISGIAKGYGEISV